MSSLPAYRNVIVCPACRSSLTESEILRCAACGASYATVDRIPVLTESTIDEHKRVQQAFFDAESDDYEVTRPRGTPRFHEWLLREKFRRSLTGLPKLSPGFTVLTICGGSGMDAEFFADRGALVVTCDISHGAALRAQRRAKLYDFNLVSVVADAERLPFRDDSFDVAYVHDGLHHLEHPEEGLRELARVARTAVSVNEPADARITHFATRVGVAERVEEAGNRVRRLSPERVAEILQDAGFRPTVIHRYGMFYRHRAGRVSRALSVPGLFIAGRGAVLGMNAVAGRWGNKLSVQAINQQTPAIRG